MRMRSLFAALLGLVLLYPVAAKAEGCGNLCTEDCWKSASIEKLQHELSLGTSVKARDENGLTPLHFAADFGTTESIRILLQTGADIGARDEDGWTPFHFAAAYGTPETIEVLLKAGADIRARDKDGKLPVDLAEGNDKIKDTDIYWELNEGRY